VEIILLVGILIFFRR